jgi:hypothetical protein
VTVVAEILGIGVTHYPPLSGRDDEMAGILRWTLEDRAIPPEVRDPASWPEAMRKEWGTDEGRAAAAEHRSELVDGFDRVREVLDRFEPDVIVIWGDDQYENFREDLIPPYAVLAYDDFEIRPWHQAQGSSAMLGKPNIWNEPPGTTFAVRGRPDVARGIVTGLLARGFDVAYAFRPLHHPGLPHAFLNTLLYLDYHRRGLDVPVVCFPLNCYGRRVVSCRGFLTRFSDVVTFDPPSPPPWRFMDLGAATARVLRETPWRVALVASSSWSHAFLCDKTWRLRPDTAGDLRLYRALQDGDWAAWRDTSLEAVEEAGQQEMLNWFALVGAMAELGRRTVWTKWVPTDVFNSNKVFAVFDA